MSQVLKAGSVVMGQRRRGHRDGASVLFRAGGWGCGCFFLGWGCARLVDRRIQLRAQWRGYHGGSAKNSIASNV